MYEHRTATFIVSTHGKGEPMTEVDDAIAKMTDEGWEFVQLTSSMTMSWVASAVGVVVVFRRRKGF